MSIQLLPYHSSDRPHLLSLVNRTISTLGPQVYAPAQVAAWSQASHRSLSQNPDPLTQGTTLVAHFAAPLAAPQTPTAAPLAPALPCPTSPGLVLGFGQLQPIDRVAFLYVATEWVGQGIGKQLYGQLEAISRGHGVTQLRTEASHLARPFFQKQGFQVQQHEWVRREGVAIDRFIMVKTMA